MKTMSVVNNQVMAGIDGSVVFAPETSRYALLRPLLVLMRAAAVLFFSLCALAEIALLIPFVTRERKLSARAAWLHDWCRFACRVLGIRVNIHGDVPRMGLLVCNHLSYLDILVLSATTPCVFVAKSDVRRWPLFGWLAHAAGAVFVNRHKKTDAHSAINVMRDAMKNGSLVVLFPEGTSSDGSTVLPFKSALLEPVLQLGGRITAGAIDYALSEGSVADEVCYWRDMTLVPHLLNLFGKRVIQSNVAFEDIRYRTRDRKIVAGEIRQQIIWMRL